MDVIGAAMLGQRPRVRAVTVGGLDHEAADSRDCHPHLEVGRWARPSVAEHLGRRRERLARAVEPGAGVGRRQRVEPLE